MLSKQKIQKIKHHRQKLVSQLVSQLDQSQQKQTAVSVKAKNTTATKTTLAARVEVNETTATKEQFDTSKKLNTSEISKM